MLDRYMYNMLIYQHVNVCMYSTNCIFILWCIERSGDCKKSCVQQLDVFLTFQGLAKYRLQISRDAAQKAANLVSVVLLFVCLFVLIFAFV